MAKKRKNAQRLQTQAPPVRKNGQPEIIYAKVPVGPPIAKPASNIQLTPIVQPIAFVPYSTSRQPLLVMDDYEDGYEDY